MINFTEEPDPSKKLFWILGGCCDLHFFFPVFRPFLFQLTFSVSELGMVVVD